MLSSFSRSVLLLAISFFLSPFSDGQVNARWAEKNEANIQCLNKKVVYKVNKDGTWTVESEIQLKILTEAGRQALSTQTYTYDATRRTLEILEAKTSFEGKDLIVPKQKIEDKPLASDPTGLRKERQILIPFERVTVGSIVYLKTREKCFNPVFEKYFSAYLWFGGGYLWEKVNILIESELPIFSKINDPDSSLEVTENKGKSKHTLQINLKKPILEDLVGESKHSHGEPSHYTTISISTETDHERIAKLEAKLYQPVMAAPLPKDLENIRIIASKIENETDRIDRVVAHLIEKITYLGSWNTAEGHFTPRSLEAIVTSGYGDCKEYSVCLAAILNRLGYKAKIALVKREEVYQEWDPLPGLEHFNHAIVKVIAPSGKTYWVDPTNNVSMAEGIFSDIAGRPAEVLDLENPSYESIPHINCQNARSIYDRVITLKGDGSVHTEGSWSLEGESAKDLTEWLTIQEPSLVKEFVGKQLCVGGDPINLTLNFTECSQRKVKPLKTIFSYDENHITIHTNYGDAFPLGGSWYVPYIATSQKDEGALFVGHPQTLIKKILFKNVSAKDLNNLAFSIQTPWLNAKRELVVTDEGVVVTETIEQLKSMISAKELKSEEFDKLRNTLRKYCDGVAIIFSKR